MSTTGLPDAGIQKVAMILMSLPESQAIKIFGLLSDEEIIAISRMIQQLGVVKGQVIDHLYRDFVETYESPPIISGGVEQMNRFLSQLFPEKKVKEMMEDIATPPNLTIWEKLDQVRPATIARYLSRETPQIIAVILSKLNPSSSAKVLAHLPESTACDVVVRCMHLEQVHADVLQQMELILKQILANPSDDKRVNNQKLVQDIFCHLEEDVERMLMKRIYENHPEIASQIQTFILNLEDIVHLAAKDLQTILHTLDLTQLAHSLVGVPESIRHAFMYQMNDGQKKMFLSFYESAQSLDATMIQRAQRLVMRHISQMIVDKQIQDPFAHLPPSRHAS